MSNVIEFRSKQKVQVPVTFWDNFKNMLRKYYTETEVHLIVASILDKDCYERADVTIKHVADLYYKFAPERSV